MDTSTSTTARQTERGSRIPPPPPLRTFALLLSILLLLSLTTTRTHADPLPTDLLSHPKYEVVFKSSAKVLKEPLIKALEALENGNENGNGKQNGPAPSYIVLPNARTGVSYACKIPSAVDNTTSKTKKPNTNTNLNTNTPKGTPKTKSERLDLLLKQLLPIKTSVSGQCMYYGEGWWTYEFCPFTHIRQYHPPPDPKTPMREEDEFYLGKFVEMVDSSSNTQEKKFVANRIIDADPSDTSSTTTTTTPDGTLTTTKSYLLQTYIDGTPCDVTFRRRKTFAKYYCDQTREGMIAIKEPASCEYEITIVSPRLCIDPKFVGSRTLKPTKKIVCVPVVNDESGSDSNPEQMKGLVKRGNTDVKKWLDNVFAMEVNVPKKLAVAKAGNGGKMAVNDGTVNSNSNTDINTESTGTKDGGSTSRKKRLADQYKSLFVKMPHANGNANANGQVNMAMGMDITNILKMFQELDPEELKVLEKEVSEQIRELLVGQVKEGDNKERKVKRNGNGDGNGKTMEKLFESVKKRADLNADGKKETPDLAELQKLVTEEVMEWMMGSGGDGKESSKDKKKDNGDVDVDVDVKVVDVGEFDLAELLEQTLKGMMGDVSGVVDKKDEEEDDDSSKGKDKQQQQQM